MGVLSSAIDRQTVTLWSHLLRDNALALQSEQTSRLIFSPLSEHVIMPRIASPGFSGRRESCARVNGELDEVAVHSRGYLVVFGHRICSGCASQSRQQSAGSGTAESAYGLQTRWNGPGHKAMGW
jgi:hypothetical protein